MNKMCQACCSELTKSDSVGDDPALVCKLCQDQEEKYRQESLKKQEGLTPYVTPLISPTISLHSTNSFVSSCSELLVNADDLVVKEDANNGVPDTGQEMLNPARGIDGSGTIPVEYVEVNIIDHTQHMIDNITSKDIEITGEASSLEGTEDGADTELSLSVDINLDPDIWLPPEAEDLEDEMESSVADNVELGGGTRCCEPCSPSRFGEECNGSIRFKEQRQKAMDEVMNGEFKGFVSRLLTLVGISSVGEAGENWVDIVTTLSWKAALLVKPETIAGKTMDPEGFVKVKCIATGSPSQSHLIKGLVFKKNAAHKHMGTKYKNPRLLLLQGMLGESSSGFLSLDSMEREKDNVKSIIDMIDITHPNVVLVEKSVSRDVQESLVAKGITLVFDMKLHRLERIARCTGSQIVSSASSLMNQKLKQCDFFHFEKFVEEHNISEEGGKKPSKTLMFLEGCFRSLGCTILLKGAHSDELKRIKSVVHYTVIVAYHFILETSFLVDQRATFSTIHSGIVDGFPKAEQHLNVGSASSATIDIPICDGFGFNSAYDGMNFNPNLTLKENSTLLGFRASAMNSYENVVGEYTKIHHNVSNNRSNQQLDISHVRSSPTILQGRLLSSLSASLRKVIEDSLPLISSASRQSFSKYFGLKEREEGYQNTAVLPAYPPPEVLTSHEMKEGKTRADELSDIEQVESLSAIVEVPSEQQKSYCSNEDEILHKNDINTVLDAQSILFLMSSRSVSRGTSCEQSHLSRIKYYRNFDVSLERFLCEVLLNQIHRCSACGEPPEAHMYSYMHQRGRLTVRVKHIPTNWCLPGEAEGKLWMWIRCLKCQQPTRRVVISTATRSLSFGKFLELSFSSHSTARKLSRCRNSLHRDYLCFYGLGPMVAMFRYSSVKIYSACMPLPVLEFNNPIGRNWIEKEAEKVLKKGLLLFTEVSNSLQKLRSGGWSSPTSSQLNLAITVDGVSEIEEMLKVERCDFEAHIKKVIDMNEHRGQDMHEILCLNGLIQELVLKSYIWDRRFCFLLFSDCGLFKTVTTNKIRHEEQVQLQQDDVGHGRIEEQIKYLQDVETFSDGTTATLISPISVVLSSAASDVDNVVDQCGSAEAESVKALDETCNEVNENYGKEFLVSESQFGSPRLESVHPNNSVNSSIDDEASDRPQMAHMNTNGFSPQEWTATTSGILSDSILGQDSDGGLSHLSACLPLPGENCDDDNLLNSIPSQVHKSIPITEESLTDTDSVANLQCHGSDMGEISNLLEPAISNSQKSFLSNIDGSQSWLWSPFSEIRKVYKKDIQKGCLHKFEFINTYTPKVLSSANQLITEEGSRLHISLGPDDNVVSLYENELTSIIACALAMSQDRHGSADDLVEEGMNVRGDQYDKIIENARSLPSDISTASPYWFSNGSLDSGVPAGGSVSSEDSYTSSFDLSKLLGLLPSLEALHPEINLGAGKSPGKGKYSVVCVYGKQFRALRRRCCPCETDYIASLSRCKNWDAKGGKSGSLFVKTLDDRFIVKQIKKTEFDSFLKFAPDYFKYINHSLNSGSQTCLAKILGIYQVTVRQAKGGKDLKYDLMIMENLIFGRSITRLYDLKGAQHGRYTSDADDTGKVFLDENFVEDMNLSPLYVSGKAKHLLQRAVWNDTSFLTSINVMDYSLLVGVDKQRGELVCGIIDYVRQYTWDKHLETWVKASLVVPKNVSPTVISPKEYKKRFRKFMSMYFLSVPDNWCSERSDPCTFSEEISYGSMPLERKCQERQ